MLWWIEMGWDCFTQKTDSDYGRLRKPLYGAPKLWQNTMDRTWPLFDPLSFPTKHPVLPVIHAWRQKEEVRCWEGMLLQGAMLTRMDFPDVSAVKSQPAMQETQEAWVLHLGWEDALE